MESDTDLRTQPGTRTTPRHTPTRPDAIVTGPAAAYTGEITRSHRRQAEPPERKHVRRALRDHVSTDFRPDVEGLRAVAVVAVILFHANLLGVSGGFIGVDVFFVLSGFLITRLLVRELASTGTLSLREFWARRMRRLLPASLLVVLATVVVGVTLLSALAQRDLAIDTVASGTYTANFVFANRLGDYFGAQLGETLPSPLLHMWSLAVEEQFYVVWPVLLVLLTRKPRQYRRLLIGVIGGLFVAGTVLSMWMTSTSPASAYYLLPARMNELLAGAAVALSAVAIGRIPATWRAWIAWAGLAAITVALFTYDGTIAFPGLAALVPVLGTVAVILGGGPDRLTWSPAWWLEHPALQWIGKHSYALYLWHWPVLVLAAAKWGDLSVFGRLFAVAVAVGLAALSFRFVENPTRHSAWLTARPERSLAIGTVFCLTLTAVGWNVARANQGELAGGGAVDAPVLEVVDAEDPGPDATVADSAAADRTTTPAAADATKSTTSTTLAFPKAPSGALAKLTAATQRVLAQSLAPAPVPSNMKPSLRSARARSQVYTDGCVNVPANSALRLCKYGVKNSSKVMLLTGDSHAAQWFEAINAIAVKRGYALVVLVKSGCPIPSVSLPTPVLRAACPKFHENVYDWITKNKPAVVVASSSYEMPKNGEVAYDLPAPKWAAGVEISLARLREVSDNVVLIGDNPSSVKDPVECLARNLKNASKCNTARDDAVRVDRRSAEVASSAAHGVLFVDTADWFCGPETCPAVVGNILMRRDRTHMTAAAALFLRPLLETAMSTALAS